MRVTNDFYENLNNFKPVFFHWLDGLLDPNVGNTTTNTKDNIINLPINVIADGNMKISICNYMVVDEEDSVNTSLAKPGILCTNIKTKLKQFYYLNLHDETINVTEFDEQKEIYKPLKKNPEELLTELVELFEFNIIQVQDETHAMSFLTFVKSNKLYICVINSGEGISFNPFVKISNSQYYSPHHTYLVCDNIKDNKKLDGGLKKIFSLIYFYFIYHNLISLLPAASNTFLVSNTENTNYVVSEQTLQMLNFVAKNCTNVKTFKYGDVKLAQLLDNRFEFQDKPAFEKTFYLMCVELIPSDQCKLTISEEFKNKINLLNKNPLSLKPTPKLNTNIIDKMIFKVVNDELCIIPQESGSCSWYSVYWALLMYYIYYQPDFQKYVNFITEINKHFYSIIENIFSSSKIQYMYTHESFSPWKIFLGLFCEIGLLDIVLLESATECLFNLKHKVEFNKISWDTPYEHYPDINDTTGLVNVSLQLENKIKIFTPIKPDYTPNTTNTSNTTKLIELNSKMMFTSILDFYNINSQQIKKNLSKMSNTFFYLCYKIFQSNQSSNIEFYKGFNVESSLNQIKLLKEKLSAIAKKDKKLSESEQNKIYQTCFEFLKANINKLGRIISTNMHVYEYYHIATFFLPYNSPDNNITSFAKFISATITATRIYLTLHKFLYLVNKHTYYVIELFGPINEVINKIIYGSWSNINYLPTTVKEYEDLIVKYSLIFNNFNSNNNDIDFFKFNSKYLMTNTKYEFNSIEFNNIYKTNTYDDFIRERDYYFNNPQFIYSNYTDSNNVSQDIFVKIHIKHIANNFNLRKKLILYFGTKFASYVNLSNYKIFLENTVSNLYLLIFLTEVDTSNINKLEKKALMTFDPDNIFLKYKYGTIKYEIFYQQIYNLYVEKGPIDFPTFLANNFTHLTKSKINKFKEAIEHIYPETVVSENVLKINGLEYYLVDASNFNFIKWFNTSSPNLTNLKQQVVYRMAEKDLCKIIFICGTHVVKIIGTYNIGNNSLTITNIIIDDSPCIKISDIQYPFKYVIPLSCNHLIYKSGSSYNVLYFASNYTINEHDRILFENKLEPQIIEIPINENNMLYPRIGHFSIFKHLCENYQIRPLNIIFTNDEIGLTCKPNYKIDEKYNWNKREFLTGNIQARPVDLVRLLNQVSDPSLAGIIIEKEPSNTGIKKLKKLLDLTNSKFADSVEKLIGKTEFCRVAQNNIGKTTEYLENLKLRLLEKISETSKLYSRENIYFILSSEHYNYLQLVKTVNIVNMLLELINDEQQFCSQLKILRELLKTRTNNYNYNFPIVFETFIGNELLEEQQNRFNSIIENYNEIIENKVAKIYSNSKTDIINYFQTGGHIYPLHHFMMGKGKSAIMTPMLMLYFSLIANKIPYIIVPEHLILETKLNMDEYALLFGSEHEVFSGSEIKNLFLSGQFLDSETNINKVFIIDEFDSLLDPTKSNYNIVENKPLDTKHLYEFIKKIVYLMSSLDMKEFNPVDVEKLKPFDSNGKIDETIAVNIIKDINQIYKNIQADTFVENINWGISKDNFLAVPYLNKDKPIANSNFSSCVITIFLTLYYYVILNELQVTELIIKCIIEKKLFSKIFKINEPIGNTRELIIELITAKPEIKTEIFSVVFDEIFYSLTLAQEQINVSFVDIINIDSIYKIGYSGTVNLELPNFPRTDNVFKMSEIIVDPDESVNVLYALVNGTTFIVKQMVNNLCLDYIRQLDKKVNLNEYDVFIDQAGIFKNIINKEVAKCFQRFFNFSRDIIFISETDQKYVLAGTHNESNYSSSKKYSKPFIYYSQGHVIGVDIRQDYLPKMKGLVTINSKSIYTNVAQAVFRLRKLNLGHTVDILYVGNENEILTSIDICELIRCNEEKQKADKSNLLVFQTLKSEVRKAETKQMLTKSLLGFNEFIKGYESKNKSYDREKLLALKNTGDLKSFNKIYKEKIKYYFIDEFPKTNIEYLNGIVKTTSINFNRLFSQINNEEILKKLVFSIDTDCSNITIQKTSEKEVVKVKEVSNTIFNENEYTIPNLQWDYIQYYFCNLKNKDIFNRITFPINKTVSCVPNICTHFNGFTFEKNNSGLLWVLIPEMEKLLLVPGYMGPIFGFEYVLLNTKDLSLLNHNMGIKFLELKELIDKLSQNEFVKFIHTGTDFYLTQQANYTAIHDIKNVFVLFIILTNLTNKLAPHVKILKILDKNATLYSDFNGLLETWSSNKYLKQIIIPHVKKLETLDPFIRTDGEYKCNINVSKFIEYNQNLEKECVNNKNKFNSNLQRQTQLAENKFNAICTQYKIEYQNHTNCTVNKQIFFDAGNTELCKKNQVEYINLETIKNNNLISLQTQEIIKTNEKIKELNNDIKKLTKPIKKLEKEITDLEELNKKTDQMEKKERQVFKNNIREKIKQIEESIKKEEKHIHKSKEFIRLTDKIAVKTNKVKQMENKINELNMENKILKSKL